MTEIQLKIDQLDYPFISEREPVPYSSRREYLEANIREICEEYVQPFTVNQLMRTLSSNRLQCLTEIEIGCFLSSQPWVVKEGRWIKNNKKQTFYRIVGSQ